MAYGAKPTAHTDLVLALSRELTTDDLHELKAVTKAKEFGNLKAGELEKIKTSAELFTKLEHKRIFSVGNYGKLKEILRKIDKDHLISEYIQETESALKKQGHSVKRERDYEESALSISAPVPMETETPPTSQNNNNPRMASQRSLDDAMPVGETMEIMDVKRESHECYPQGKGYVLFLNNFVDTERLKRFGCKKDSDHIEELFDDELNYKFVKFEDLTKAKLEKVLDETRTKLRKGNFSKFILILCSHGDQKIIKNSGNKKVTEELIVMVDETAVTEEELTAPFMADKLPELEGKPKVFIIQACRAPSRDSSDDLTSDQQGPSTGERGPPSLSCPVNADVLISYATTKGTKAWRNEENGSWFIHHFCEIAKAKYKNEHLMDLLVRVNKEVAEMESTENRAKQMPCQISTLTRQIWL